MRTPDYAAGDVTYQALPARRAASVPPELACWAEWVVVRDGQSSRPAGWIVTDPGGHDQTGEGPYACYLGSGGQEEPAYIRNVVSRSQGTRVVGDADNAAAILAGHRQGAP